MKELRALICSVRCPPSRRARCRSCLVSSRGRTTTAGTNTLRFSEAAAAATTTTTPPPSCPPLRHALCPSSSPSPWTSSSSSCSSQRNRKKSEDKIGSVTLPSWKEAQISPPRLRWAPQPPRHTQAWGSPGTRTEGAAPGKAQLATAR